MHMPFRKLSFARVGDERWTAIPADSSTGLQWANFHSDAVYNAADGLFYVVRADDSIQTLDLNGPSPVAAKFMPLVKEVFDEPFRYLLQTPWGDLLQAWRFRDYYFPPSYGEQGGESENDAEGPDPFDYVDPRVELNTTEVRLYKVDVPGERLVKVDSVGDHALFLGYNGSMCLPIKCFPGLKPNCAYITDDFFEYINCCKFNKREIGVWSIQNQTLHSLGGSSPPNGPWLNWPAPVWITPSLL